MRGGLVVVALLLAGCAAPTAPDVGRPGDAAEALAFEPPVPVSLDFPGAEPVIAVASDGTLYAEGIGSTGNGNVNKVWRSDDGGASWVDVTPPALGEARSNDGFVAVGNACVSDKPRPQGRGCVGNGDRVYAANVFQTTFQLFRSDDKGASWVPLPVPKVPALMHRHWIVPTGERTVHVAVEGFPPGFLPYLAGQPGLDAVQGTPNDGMWYVRSDDLGETWTLPQHVDPKVNFAGQGPLVASADGQRLYVPRYEDAAGAFAPTYEKGHWYLLASEDGGDSWERREMFDLDAELSTAVPGLALDEAGTLHFVWTQAESGSSRLRVARSSDGGRSWTQESAGPQAGTMAMAWVAARGTDLGVMWYAADVEGPASRVDAPWFVDYMEVTANGTRVARVTPEPVHHGNVCARGPACRQGEDRRLLDYPWLVFDPEGRPNVVFASTEWERPSAFMVFARGR